MLAVVVRVESEQKGYEAGAGLLPYWAAMVTSPCRSRMSCGSGGHSGGMGSLGPVGRSGAGARARNMDGVASVRVFWLWALEI